jgi:hypothetical protein
MKRRMGFVSNSSSSCFVLDLRQDGVKDIVSKLVCSTMRDGMGRATGKLIGKEAVRYAHERIQEWGTLGHGDSLGSWILTWSGILGDENIVILQQSDEDMGGGLFSASCYDEDENPMYSKMQELALAEIESH